MRNLQLLVILVIIIFAVSLIQKGGLENKETQRKNITIPTPTPTQTPAPTFTPASISTSAPTSSISTLSSQQNLSSFIYPGSIILNQSGGEIILQSTDDPQVITNWYKEKITNMGMNAKSFVQTNTNG